MTFDGVTPDSGVYSLTIFGSNHFGFGDVSQSFTITVAAHDFDMANPLPPINTTVGGNINYTVPLRGIAIDHIPVLPSNITVKVNTTSIPSLSYDPSSRTISGQIPNGITAPSNLTLPVLLIASYGNQIQTNISVNLLSNFFTTPNLPGLEVTPGQSFNYDLNPYLANPIVQLSATFSSSNTSTPSLIVKFSESADNASSWISLDPNAKTLSGTAPSEGTDNVTVTLSMPLILLLN